VSRNGAFHPNAYPKPKLNASPDPDPSQNKYAAQRALQRDGEQLTAALMVGVRRLDPSHRAAIKWVPGTPNRKPATMHSVMLCHDEGLRDHKQNES